MKLIKELSLNEALELNEDYEEDAKNLEALSAISKVIEETLKENQIKYNSIEYENYTRADDLDGSIAIYGVIGDLEEVGQLLEDEIGYPYEIENNIIIIDPTQEYEDEDGEIGVQVSRDYLDEELSDKNTCVLCGKQIRGYGNNAEPLKRGRCCDICNKEKVIPARLKQLGKTSKIDEDLDDTKSINLSKVDVVNYIMNDYELNDRFSEDFDLYTLDDIGVTELIEEIDLTSLIDWIADQGEEELEKFCKYFDLDYEHFSDYGPVNNIDED